MEGVLRSRFGVTGFELSSPASAYRGLVSLWQADPDVSLTYAECDGDVALALPGSDSLRLYFGVEGQTLQGSGGNHECQGPGSFGLVGPSSASVTHYLPGSRLLAMRISRARLRTSLGSLLGRAIPDDIVFAPCPEAVQQSTGVLRQLVDTLVARADHGATALPPILTHALLEAIITTLLTSQPHNWSAALEAPAPLLGSTRLRQAEEFIRAHWDQPLTVEAIARAAGCSTRSLFKSFQTVHGVGPIVFLRRTRLEHARRMLSDPGEQTVSVASVGTRCGFSNMGHFARYYQERFGVLPSQTLRLTRLHHV
ncbi:MAG: AraC family transcriptional regulator [Hyphomicrobiaceae bacterium]|nr:AraC family transcriptional regulator [Hyphomicrobiaceae bacterium]